MKSNNHITIKVVSQVENLVYEGVRQNTKLASVSKMNALLGINNPKKSRAEEVKFKTSTSFELYTCEITSSGSEGSAAEIPQSAVTLCAEGVLNRFMTLGDHASAKRKQFFDKVEEGKERLLAKYGEHKAVPKEEVAALSRELRPYGCTIWKHQIVVTRTQDTSFEGARLTKDGRYTATVKSKTIYTMAPLSDAQLNELKQILNGELKVDSSNIAAQRVSLDGYVALWKNPSTGKIVMTEDISQFS